MTIRIDGTNTTANPGITGGDADTGLQFGTDEVKIVTGGNDRVTVDSSGKVGLGTSSPISDFHVLGTTGARIQNSADTDAQFLLTYSSNSPDFRMLDTTGATTIKLLASGNSWFTGGNVGIGTTSPSGKLTVDTETAATNAVLIAASTETGRTYGLGVNASASFVIHEHTAASDRLVIDSSGRLLVGTSSEITSSDIASFLSSGSVLLTIKSSSLSNNEGVYFSASSPDGSQVGQIGVLVKNNADPTGFIRLDRESGTGHYFWVDNSANFRISTNSAHVGTTNGTVVGTQTSDERLKNVGNLIGYGLNEVLQLQPKKYALKEEPDTNKLGFIAQEVESIIPEAVFDTGEELEGHQEGDRTKLGMEYVQLIPVLVNAIKQQQAIITDLQARLSALEAS